MDTAFTKNDQRAIAAEFLGTLFFVFIGTGAVVGAAEAWPGLDGGTLVAIALAHGLGIVIAVAWTANISGGHINPAVTLAMIIAKKITVPLGVAYMIAQFAGAAVGSFLLLLCMPDAIDDNLGRHALTEGMASGEGLLLEILMTAFFLIVIFNVAVSNKGWGLNAPIAIGLAIAVIHLIGVPFTGASVNPARTFGPDLVTGEWDDFWVYLVGPFAGAAAVAFGWLWWKDYGEDSLDPDMPAVAPAVDSRAS
ncbi:MAG: MIP family channel protein [Dehalococcoidia bacterium]